MQYCTHGQKTNLWVTSASFSMSDILPQVELGSICILALFSHLSVEATFFVWIVMYRGPKYKWPNAILTLRNKNHDHPCNNYQNF